MGGLQGYFGLQGLCRGLYENIYIYIYIYIYIENLGFRVFISKSCHFFCGKLRFLFWVGVLTLESGLCGWVGWEGVVDMPLRVHLGNPVIILILCTPLTLDIERGPPCIRSLLGHWLMSVGGEGCFIVV